jgi:hypothetical protein
MSEDTVAPAEGSRERADRRFAIALQQAGLPDPRERYREWLRELRARDEGAFRKALEYFEQQLVPTVADPGSDAVAAWTEYGLRLAQRLQSGSAVAIDATGLSRPCDATAPLADLVLHLPSSTREKALPVRLPSRLSPAQEAAYALLVRHELG